MIAARPVPELRMLDAALRYAAAGHPVFPLVPRGKIPLIAKADGGQGFHDATTEAQQIEAWWAHSPHANIGIATGHTFDVLDVDPQHGGEETLAALVVENGPLPTTPATSTGSGGRHILFIPDARVRCSAGRLGSGLDVRGRGGYIVAPPSLHPSGRAYRWRVRGVPLAPWPRWLLELLVPPAHQIRSGGSHRAPLRIGGSRYALAVLRRSCEAIEAAAAHEGHRHDTLRRKARTVAGFVASGELSEDLARACLLDAWIGAGLEHRRAEAERTIAWAFESGRQAPLCTPRRSP